MWSSIRHYGRRAGRDDDITLSCSCITDWCFIWCSNQCSKKTGSQSTESSQLTNETDESTTANSCCKITGCSPRTVQVQNEMENVSQVLQEGDAEETDLPQTAEDRNPQIEDLDVGRWSNLRKFRPRLFPGRTSVSGVPGQVPNDEEKPSRFRRMSSWLRNLYHRQEESGSATVSPSEITAKDVTAHQPCEQTEVETFHESVDYRSPWGDDQSTVFSRSSCGYESFHPNCCRLHETMMYALQETAFYEAGVESQAQELAQETIPLEYHTSEESHNTECGQQMQFIVDPLGNIAAAAITVVTSSSSTWELDRQQEDVPTSKLTRVHTSEPQEYYKGLTGAHTDNAMAIGGGLGLYSDDQSHAVGPVETSARPEANIVYRTIPQVIITGTSSPIRHIANEYDHVEQSKTIDTDSQRSSGCFSEDTDVLGGPDEESTQKDIVNYMINISPQTPKTKTSGGSTEDGRKKTVRFKDATCFQPAKGRAVYIGTFKHASAFRREIIECAPVMGENFASQDNEASEGCKRVQGENVLCDPVSLVNQQSKGVYEYANEYSELCKASVDQEREILQNVIDSVRECFNAPTSLETSPKKHS